MSALGDITHRVRVKLLRFRAWTNRRRYRRVKLIGITGSAGKTTTKDLCAVMLSEFAPCVSTERSQNVAMSTVRLLLQIDRATRYCVAEMAAYRPGVLSATVGLAKPDVGVFTVVERDHYSAFKSIEAIAEEKSQLILGLPPDGVAILNIDDPLVRQVAQQAPCRVISIGRSENADIRLISAHSLWPEPLTLTVRTAGEEHILRTQLHGEHLAINVLAAIGVASALGLPMDQALTALARAVPAEGRMQPAIGADGVSFIRDDFKSPHWSLGAPLELLRTANSRRKIAVIGTISDSPQSPSRRYVKIARDVRQVADLAVFVGRDAPKALKARVSPEDPSVQAFLQLRDANEFLRRELQRGDLVLLKGTDKQDHLMRLILDRTEPVKCWRENCNVEHFCNSCEMLGVEEPEPTGSHAQWTNQNESYEPADNPTRVVVGLGNPGSRYAETPHNAGHLFVDYLARQFSASWKPNELGEQCSVELDGKHVVLFKPSVPMNLSGAPVRDFLRRIGGHPNHVTVSHDEIDLNLGDVRLKRGGGDAGHKGIRSVVAVLGTDDFSRLRIGVRAAEDIRKARQIVLERLSAAQLEALEAACKRGAELIRSELDPAARSNVS